MGKVRTCTLVEVDPTEDIGVMGERSEARDLGTELGVAPPGLALAAGSNGNSG